MATSTGMFEKKRKPDDLNDRSIHGRWQTPPFDTMENIVQRLNISDRIRLCIVCKYWSSIAMRRDIRCVPEFPWLVLTQRSSEYLDLSIASEGKVIELGLPKRNQGWFHSSSKGWLIMVKGLNPKVFLLNPISGAKHKLPSLRTIPSFQDLFNESKFGIRKVFRFLCHIALSSSSISDCTVAAIFSSMEIGLCRPGEKSWSIFQTSNYKNDYPLGIQFSSHGVLYTLVQNHDTEGGRVTARTLSFGDGAEVQLKLVYNKKSEELCNEVDENIIYRDQIYKYKSYLIESTTSNEVWVINQMKNSILTEPDVVENWTRAFMVYKIDPENGGSFIRVPSLENQILFVEEHGSLSFPANNSKGLEGNCIYFEEGRRGTLYVNFEPRGQRLSNESGIFYLDGRKFERSPPFYDTLNSTRCGLSWFSPSSW